MRKTLIGMAAIVLIGGLGIIACSTPAAEEPTSTPAPALESSDVGSPEVVVHEMPIDLPVGETYEIALDSNPTTGYGWQVEYNDWDLELVEQRFEPESDSDVVGAGGKEVFVFRGRTVSSGDVVFTYKRSWEDEVLKTERYTFDVLAGRFDEMSLSDAMAIASESECVGAGPLMANAVYNKFTGTWWIDVDAQKEFCPSPACVVNVATKEAEINWRCTGALPPQGEEVGVTPGGNTTPDAGVYFPRRLPPDGPSVDMMALFFGRLVEVDGCIRARNAHDDYLVIWPHDFSVRTEGGAISILDGSGQLVLEVGDLVRFGGGEVAFPQPWQELPAQCPGRYWVMGREVDRARDVVLETYEVLELGVAYARDLLVQGHLLAKQGDPLKLCSALMESFPPQCGQPHLVVEGLDLAGISDLQTEGNVTWSNAPVKLRGSVRDGVLTID